MKNFRLTLIALAAFALQPGPAFSLSEVTSSNPDTGSAAESTQKVSTPFGTEISTTALDGFIPVLMANTGVPGASVAISEDGKTTYTGVFGIEDVMSKTPVTPTTIFEAASLSKPVFGFLAMMFVEDGLLDLDRPLAEYLPFPELEDQADYRSMTARHVLSHQTGLPNWRDDSVDEGLTLKFAPGEGYFYSGEGYQYLARVMAHLAKTDDAGLEDMFQRRIAGPLGMTQTKFVADADLFALKATPHKDGSPLAKKRPSGEFGAAYSIHTNASDYAKWVNAVLKRDLLKPETYAEYFKPQDPAIPADDPNRALGLTNWALGFSIYETPFGRLEAHGGNNPGFTSFVFVSRDTNWGLAFFTNADQANNFTLGLIDYLAGGQLSGQNETQPEDRSEDQPEDQGESQGESQGEPMK
ncbi:MAG: serine hydrolase domain-containing protein [Pseudomonadota bacterium]